MVKFVFREVSGYVGSVLTISDQNRVLWGVFLDKKFLRDFTTDQICWFGKNWGKIWSPIFTPKVVKFGFALYLGGFVRVYMGFRLLWDKTGL